MNAGTESQTHKRAELPTGCQVHGMPKSQSSCNAYRIHVEASVELLCHLLVDGVLRIHSVQVQKFIHI